MLTPAQKVYQRNYRLAHREDRNAACSAWKKNNPEKAKAMRKRWRDKNPDYWRSYSQKTKAKRRAYLMDYRATRKESASAYSRTWRKNNAAKVKLAHVEHYRQNASSYKIRARKRAGIICLTDKSAIKKISAWESVWRSKRTVRCFWCLGVFRPTDCHTDHITPLSKHGLHEIENLCVSCSFCNLSKRDKSPETWNTKIKQPTLSL